jgi:hypothetical protein
VIFLGERLAVLISYLDSAALMWLRSVLGEGQEGHYRDVLSRWAETPKVLLHALTCLTESSFEGVHFALALALCVKMDSTDSLFA